ncbi:TorD/DmsD family molecular chaperone [Gordonibacter massiliensis (ex Traore et al. 2017)]|uniref:Molecular chaperone TorD family protein n=1 Tax=Gordonibacter massiliensis (ex Traore et al. 2017) TaxID=1841863 RepID=A0A842JJN4_9ACTN|nr:molecular chaperone TorD family protein [Gordonibacter massiliensis (ex Traore et al. 2017)]MBC2890038.1 molecular chaperone TorD family protein [Gordonibacter massiliensis (ex Traore et al. 2017)]
MNDTVRKAGEAPKPSEASTWQVRAAAYELLALSFRYPDRTLAEAVASGEWEEAATEVVKALGVPMEDGFQSGQVDGRGIEELLHALRVEATRLFVGAPEPLASPFEGVWRAADDGVQALLFVNPHSMEVERFMGTCGLGRPEGTNEPLDHASTELELLQWLCMLACGIAEAPDGIEAPEGGWAGAHDRFLEEHVRTWMPRFARKAAEETREPFYRSAAGLLEALLDGRSSEA